MSEHTIDGGNFVPMTQEGDPGKLEYLHNANWQGKTMVGGTRPLKVDARVCPGCLFPDAAPGKWPHLKDARCFQFASDSGLCFCRDDKGHAPHAIVRTA